MQCLHGAVFHRRDAQRAQLSVGLRNVDTPQRLRLITAPPQCADGFVFGRRGVARFSRPPRTFVCLDCPSLVSRPRLCRKTSRSAAVARLSPCPSDFSCVALTIRACSLLTLAFTLGPVNLFPSGAAWPEDAHAVLLRVHLLFPPAKVLRVFSSRTTRWKSARLHGGVMLQPLSAPLQSGLRFFQHPLPAIPSAFLADAPASTRRRDVGFTMLGSNDTNELAPAFHTGSLECPCAPCVQQEHPTASPFGRSLSASLAR